MMYSCCCIDPCVGDTASFHQATVRMARKAHICGECNEVIQPGEKYELTSSIFDGAWDHWKTCWFCLAIRRDFFTYGWYYGMLRDDFLECNGWDYVTGKLSRGRSESDFDRDEENEGKRDAMHNL